MSAFINFITLIVGRARMAIDGVAALFQVGAAVLSAKGDGLKAKAAAAFAEPRLQRIALRALRAFVPNLVLSRQLIGAYPNTGTAIVTRYQDVVEVLDRNADFEVVYEPKMRAITGGENFFLGMQDTALYTRDVSNMRLAMRRDDVPPSSRLWPAVSPSKSWPRSRAASTYRKSFPCRCRPRSSPIISASTMRRPAIWSTGRH
jgi:hypothetical protein